MADVTDYTSLITSEHADKPKYIATVSLDVSVQVRVQNLLATMLALFDIDMAVGQQLDFIGEWVGVSRNVNVPIPGVYFQWDGSDPTVGWDFGTWQGNLTPGAVTVLPDDAYKTLIKARIASNSWDGTTDGAYAIYDALFPNFTVLIQDYQNMSYSIAIVGGLVDALTLALITGGYIPLKPEGVRINNYFVPVDSNPLFSWDIENDNLQGWEEGSWAMEIDPT